MMDQHKLITQPFNASVALDAVIARIDQVSRDIEPPLSREAMALIEIGDLIESLRPGSHND